MSTGFIFFRFAEQRSPWTSVDHNLDGLLNSGGFGRTIAFGRLVGGLVAPQQVVLRINEVVAWAGLVPPVGAVSSFNRQGGVPQQRHGAAPIRFLASWCPHLYAAAHLPTSTIR